MKLKRAAQWVAGLLVVGLLLLLLSIFIADRQLEPPFDAAELGPIDVPSTAPLDAGVTLFSSDSTGNFELYFTGPNGRPQPLTSDPNFDSWRPRLSPNRMTVLFYRSPAGVFDSDLTQASLWMVGAQGGEPVEVLPVGAHGWLRHGRAEWSPTGTELVMMGERPPGIQIWVTSIDGRDVRNLVNTAGDNTDPSWSPDAKRVLFVACVASPCPDDQREVFAIVSSGGERVQITDDDVQDAHPVFSPDGSRIAMQSLFPPTGSTGERTAWDIRVIPTNRSAPARRLMNDDTVNRAPVWLDDQNMVFDRVSDAASDAGVFEIRVSDSLISAVVNTTANERFPDR